LARETERERERECQRKARDNAGDRFLASAPQRLSSQINLFLFARSVRPSLFVPLSESDGDQEAKPALRVARRAELLLLSYEPGPVAADDCAQQQQMTRRS